MTLKMTQKKIIAGCLLILGIIVLILVVLFMKPSKEVGVVQVQDIQQVSKNEPVDIVLDFYNLWLKAAKSTSSNPYTEKLQSYGLLSKELRTRIIQSEGHGKTEIDPVLCQITLPTAVTSRIVSTQENKVRVLVMAKEKELTAQSVFTVVRHNDGWFIQDISCSPGEFDIPQEFTFNEEGHLLKGEHSPLNPKYWHLVFEENGEQGHFAPLLFTATSTCVAKNASVSVCVPEQFIEASKVHVYGQMTDIGPIVARLEFLE